MSILHTIGMFTNIQHRKFVKDDGMKVMEAVVFRGKVTEMHFTVNDPKSPALPLSMDVWTVDMTPQQFEDKIVKEMGYMEQ